MCMCIHTHTHMSLRGNYTNCAKKILVKRQEILLFVCSFQECNSECPCMYTTVYRSEYFYPFKPWK